MKQASTALINLLHNSDQFYIADLYKITLTNGNVIRWTSADYDLVVGDELYESFTLEREDLTTSIGIQVDELSFTLLCDGTETIFGGMNLIPAFNNGSFMNAKLELYRVFLPEWQPQISTDYTLLLFVGIISSPKTTGFKAEIKAKSVTNLLNIKLPRNVYMAQCVNTVYDNLCGISREAYTETCTVLAGSTRSKIKFSTIKGVGYYTFGMIKFNNGPNTSVSRGIKEHTAGYISFAKPLDVDPQPGDTFIIRPGCDGCKSTCKDKFNNLDNFRGFPFIPTPETIY